MGIRKDFVSYGGNRRIFRPQGDPLSSRVSDCLATPLALASSWKSKGAARRIVNLKGVLYGIAAALPVFRRQNFGHFVNVISTAGLQIIPTMAVYAGTKNAVRTITETLRQKAGAKLRVTGISPGFVQTNLTTSMSDPEVKAQIGERMQKMAIPPAAIARAIAFAIEQPAEVDVNEIVIRPTAQG